MIKNKWREENGSVTVLVVATLLSFLTILSTAYVVNTTVRKSQLESTIKVKKIYESELQEEEAIYQRMTQNSIYKEDFLQWNNYKMSNQTINSCKNGILDVTSTSGDPMIYMNQVTSFDPKVYRYIEIKYKTSATTAGRMELFMIENPTDQAYVISQPIKNDGNWHTLVIDLWSNPNVLNRSAITGWRFDWAGVSGVNMQIDYIRVIGAPTNSTSIQTNSYIKSSLVVDYDTLDHNKDNQSQTSLWKDSSGNNKNAMFEGINGTQTSGWNENGLTFDGIDCYSNTGITQNSLGGEITIHTVIQNEAINNYRGIWGAHNGRSDEGVDGLLAQWHGNELKIGYGKSIVSILADKINNKKISLTAVMKNGEGTKVYINGNLIAQKNAGDSITPLGNIWIGKSWNDGDRYFKGTMSKFMIYDRALTDQEVMTNYLMDRTRYNVK